MFGEFLFLYKVHFKWDLVKKNRFDPFDCTLPISEPLSLNTSAVFPINLLCKIFLCG